MWRMRNYAYAAWASDALRQPKPIRRICWQASISCSISFGFVSSLSLSFSFSFSFSFGFSPLAAKKVRSLCLLRSAMGQKVLPRKLRFILTLEWSCCLPAVSEPCPFVCWPLCQKLPPSWVYSAEDFNRPLATKNLPNSKRTSQKTE